MKLSLAEGLYLIALDDEEGRLLSAAEKTIVPGVVSACILELSLLKKIAFEDLRIKLLDKQGTGNKILDDVFKHLKEGENTIDTVKRLSPAFKDVQIDLNELLVHRGILKKEATKLLWIPLSERMDNANYAFESEIRKALKSIVLKGTRPSPPFVVLTSLIYDCNLMEEVFHDKDELIDAIKVGKDIVKAGIIDPEKEQVLQALK
ncbi:MAG: GPP34 family phosphoprotein, partial [Cyclobacteriaceae bacterium]